MEGLNRLSNLSASLHTSRQTLLPPIGALRNISPSYANPHGVVGSEATQKPKEEQSHHQRCSSESFLVEQPSWLDDLLNEPDTLVHKGHRRSASDSSAYLGPVAQIFNTNKEYSIKSSVAKSSWGFHSLVPHIDPWHTSFEKLPSFSDKQHNRVCELSFNSLTSSTGHSPAKDCITRQSSVSSSSPKESERLPSTALKKRDQEDCVFQIPECATQRSNGLQTKPFMSKAEAKRAKQQSAHRSRVRKLQYIADLERNIQVLQAEGSEVSAAFEFLDQQNLILGMENRALRQRLDSLSQEHLIKHLEQDMLEREIARLQTLYQLQLQQQQQQQQAQQQHKHSRNRSRELDAQFANLSIKN